MRSGEVKLSGRLACARLAAASAALVMLLCVGCSNPSMSDVAVDSGGNPMEGGENGGAQVEDSPSAEPVRAEYESRRGGRVGAVASYDELRDCLLAGQEESGSGAQDFSTGCASPWDTAICEGGCEANEYAPSNVVADGECIFVRYSGLDGETGAQATEPYIGVVDVSSGSPVQVATIEAQDNCRIATMYAQGGKLYVLELVAGSADDGHPWSQAARTRLLTYAFDDLSKPELVAQTEQSGAYMTARFVDGYAYVASVYDPSAALSGADAEFCAPVANDVLFAPEDICASAFDEAERYLVITAIPLDDSDSIADRIALAGSNAQHYVGDTAFYDVEERWVPNTSGEGYHPETSVIRKVSYGDGRFDFSWQATIEGGVAVQTMSERNGMLRMQVDKNVDEQDGFQQILSFAVFDESMSQVGMAEDIGVSNVADYVGTKDDVAVYRVYGDEGEALRFIDLSDPQSMALSDPTDALVVSDLRSYGPGMALGVARHHGEAADGGHLEGSLLTMLDVSNPSAVAQVGALTLEGVWSSGLVSFYEPVAYMDSSQGIILFISVTEPDYETYFYGLRVSEEGSLELAKKELVAGELNNSFCAVKTDGTGGEVLWVVVNGAVARCDPETLELSDFAKW